MRAFIVLGCLLFWGVVSGDEPRRQAAQVTVDACSDGVRVDGVYHDRHVIKNISKAGSLSVDRHTNTLYFRYVPDDDRSFTLDVAYIDLNTETFDRIIGASTIMATAVDQANGIVYISSSDGIYKFNYTTKYATLYQPRGKSILSMFYKEKLYFIEYPTFKLYALNNGQPELVPGFEDMEPRLFTIDNTDQIMYVNMSGLFGLKKGAAMDKLKYYRSNFLFTGVGLNAHGKPFFSGNLGIYDVGYDNVLKVIVDIDEPIYGVTFDKDDNMIYSTENQIVKLIRSNKRSCSIPVMREYRHYDKGELLRKDGGA